jgi:hypothetical protein
MNLVKYPRPGVLLTLVAIGLASGCGLSPGTGDVSGKVYFKGKEVTSGFVTMVGRDGTPRNSAIAEDGSYQIAGLPAGEVKIVVTSPPTDPAKAGTGRKAPLPRPGVEPRERQKPTTSDHQKKTWREIPARFADVTASDLRYTVVPGLNHHDVKMD